MNLFKSFTLKWWQGSLFKISMIAESRKVSPCGFLIESGLVPISRRPRIFP